ARLVLNNFPDKALLRLTQRKLSFIDLVHEQSSVPPVNMKSLGAPLPRDAHLLGDHVEQFDLVRSPPGTTKVVGSFVVDSFKVALVEPIVKLLNRYSREPVVVIDTFAATPKYDQDDDGK